MRFDDSLECLKLWRIAELHDLIIEPLVKALNDNMDNYTVPEFMDKADIC